MFKDIIEAFSECESIACKCYGEEDQTTIDILNELFSVLFLAHECDEFADKYDDMMKILHRKIKKEMSELMPSERADYLQGMDIYLNTKNLYEVSLSKLERFANSALNALIFNQSLLLESDVSLRKLIEEKGSIQDRAVLQDILNINCRIKQLNNGNQSNLDTIIQLSKELNRQEVRLYSNFKKFYDAYDLMDIDLKDIVKTMPKNSILVNFCEVGNASGGILWAFVTRKEDGKTELFTLLVNDWFNKMVNGSNIDIVYKGDNNEQMMEWLWKPISRYVTEGCSIYYVPAGVMHNVSLEWLSDTTGQYLGEKYNFERLTSARELVKRKAIKKRMPKQAVLYGGLKYQSGDTMSAESRDDGTEFGELEFSKNEIDSIEGVIDCRVNVVKYTGEKWNKESFKAFSSSAPDILHIATHGYYYTPDEANDDRTYSHGHLPRF